MPTTVPRHTTFWTFPEFVVFWPIILVGVVLPDLQKANPDVFTNHTAAMFWAGTLILTCIACGMDFGRSTAVMIFLGLIAAFFGTMWYGAEHHLSVFADFRKWINAQNLLISYDLQRLISWGLLVGYVWMILDVLVSSRKFQATFGQIERARILRGPQYYRNTRTQPARALLDDMLDYLLTFGGVRVYAVNATTGKIESLGIAVGWGSKLDERLDTYAEATPTHELGPAPPDTPT